MMARSACGIVLSMPAPSVRRLGLNGGLSVTIFPRPRAMMRLTHVKIPSCFERPHGAVDRGAAAGSGLSDAVIARKAAAA